MIKSSCSLLLCFCFFVSLAGQKNLQPAELQTLDGAVIHGKIDYRNWDLNPKEILFFLNDESPEQKIRVLDIKGFSVQTGESKWEKYVSFLGDIDRSPYRHVSGLDRTPEPRWSRDTFFIRTLVEGELSLYKLNDESGRVHYLAQKGDEPVQALVYKKYVYDDLAHMAYNSLYIRQIAKLVAECDPLLAQISKLGYTETSLIPFFDGYNRSSCNQGATTSFIEKKEKSIWVPYIFLGANISQLHFIGDSDPNRLVYHQMSSSNHAVFGAGFDFILGRTKEKSLLSAELLYTGYKTSGSYFELIDPNQSKLYATEIDLAYIKLQTFYRWIIYKGNWSPNLVFGISNGWSVKDDQKTFVTTQLFTFSKTEEYFAVRTGNGKSGFRPYETAYIAGVGLSHKKWRGEIRYERSNGFSSIFSVATPVRWWHFLIQYRF